MPLLISLLLLATQLSVAEQVVDVVENEAVEDNLVLIEINSTVHIVEKTSTPVKLAGDSWVDLMILVMLQQMHPLQRLKNMGQLLVIKKRDK